MRDLMLIKCECARIMCLSTRLGNSQQAGRSMDEQVVFSPFLKERMRKQQHSRFCTAKLLLNGFIIL